MLNQEYGRPALGIESVHTEFVPVLFASSMEQARLYKTVLEANNIPVLLESERGEDKIYSAFAKAIPVLVPDNMHDRASDIVADAELCGAADVYCGKDDDLDDTDDGVDEGLDGDLDDDLDDEFGDVDDDFDDEDEDDFDEDEE